MLVVSFPWNPQLLSLRRDTVPRARWDKATRTWRMTTADAETFLQAAQARMYFARCQSTVTIDSVVWIVGFAQGTPYRRDAPGGTSVPPADRTGSSAGNGTVG